MPPNNFLALHLLCHLYVYFSHVIGSRQIYNGSTYSEISFHTFYGKAINYSELGTNEEVRTVLFEQEVFNYSLSNDQSSRVDSNTEKYKMAFVNNFSPDAGTTSRFVKTYESDGSSQQTFKENLSDSSTYNHEKFHLGSQHYSKGSLTKSTNLIRLIFQKPSKNNRMIRSDKEFHANSSNQLVSARRIKSENRLGSFDDVVYPDTNFLSHSSDDGIQIENVTTPDISWDFSTQLNDSEGWNATECAPNFNCTDIRHAPRFRTRTLIKCVVLLGLGTAAVIGNVATLTSIIRRGRQKTSTVYLLLLHLSIADLMVTWFCIIGEGIWMLAVQWYAGNAFCKFFKFLQMLALYLSTFILVVIGLDRLCAVRFPMRRIKARVQVQKYVFVAWMLSCGLSAPQAFIFRVARGPFVEEFYQCVTYGFYTAPWQEQVYTSISLFCMFLIPLGILVSTYAATFATIARRNRVFGGDRNPFVNARCKILRKAKVKSLWITVVIVSTFIVCWTPYYISMIISVFLNADDQVGQGLHEVIFFFGSSTAVLNPVIYGAFHLRKTRPATLSNRTTSTRAETTWAMSTLRRFKLTNGKSASSSLNLGASTLRRNTRKTQL